MEKLQVVFLVDTRAASSGSTLVQQDRAQCLACTRILVSNEALSPQWNYKLFRSDSLSSIPVNTIDFLEVRSELLEQFFNQLSVQKQKKKLLTQHTSWGRCVYNALATAVQDFTWDAPEIKSPVRPRTRYQGARKRGTTIAAPDSSPSRNIIFLFSEGPNYRTPDPSAGEDTDPTVLVNQVLPKPLLSQLRLKGIRIHWVLCGVETNTLWIRELSKSLREVGGAVVSLNALLEPAHQMILIPKLLSGRPVRLEGKGR
jgi:hypothetical protein